MSRCKCYDGGRRQSPTIAAPNRTTGMRHAVALTYALLAADPLAAKEDPPLLPVPEAEAHRWALTVPKWDEMVAALEEAELDVTSVHATQGRISEPSFLTWGRQTRELSERLGARTVTVHPNRAKKTKPNSQALAQQRLRALQRETEVMTSAETFGGRDRVFTPDEIMG